MNNKSTRKESSNKVKFDFKTIDSSKETIKNETDKDQENKEPDTISSIFASYK